MAFIPAPDTVRVSLEFVWAGQIVAITISVKRPGGWTSSTVNDLYDVVYDWWTNSVKPGLTNTLSLQNINILDLSSSSAPSYNFPVSPAEPGGSVSPSLPLNATIASSFQTLQRGRSFRGRVYMPGLTQAWLNNAGTITSAWQATILSWWINLLTAFAANAWQHVVVSRVADGVPRTTAVVTPIIGYFVEQHLDSQRRRLVGRGS